MIAFFSFHAKSECGLHKQSDIQEAKNLPEPVIDRTEYDLKDELIRQTILDTQDDVDEIKDKLDKIDERLYEIQKNN